MTVFVSGASGQLGRAVVLQLLDQGVPVIAGTRNPDKLADLAERGAQVRRADFNDAESLRAAFQGVDRALLISIDAIGQRTAPQLQAVRIAAEAGVGHVVYTSVSNADVPGMALAEEHLATETAIRAHFDSYTVLRNNLYAELLLAGIGPALATGQLVTARQDGRIAWVSRQDCARAAAAALTDGFEGARILDVAGPEALSGEQTAALFAELAGTPVVHVSIPGEALQAGMVEAGVPAPLAGALVAFDESAAAGLLDRPDADFQALVGEPARSARAVLEANRAVWQG